VTGVKPRVDFQKAVQLGTTAESKMAADGHFSSFRWAMLHLLAQCFAPVTLTA
jgi:hypothetical protein